MPIVAIVLLWVGALLLFAPIVVAAIRANRAYRRIAAPDPTPSVSPAARRSIAATVAAAPNWDQVEEWELLSWWTTPGTPTPPWLIAALQSERRPVTARHAIRGHETAMANIALDHMIPPPALHHMAPSALPVRYIRDYIDTHSYGPTGGPTKPEPSRGRRRLAP